MRDEIADLVHRVVSRGLFLQGKLLELPQPDPHFLQSEHASLLGMLSGPDPVRRLADYDGDPRQTAGAAPQSGDLTLLPKLFLGIRYALACWLDEIVIPVKPWVNEWWENHTLEFNLYSIKERHWKFWEQAELAEYRLDVDALEVAYLCVMLGFRGKYRGDTPELRKWRARVETRLRAVLRAPEPDQPLPMRPALDQAPRLGYRLYRLMWAVLLFVGSALALGGIVYLLAKS
jgi:type VI secretion system protein ImpK